MKNSKGFNLIEILASLVFLFGMVVGGPLLSYGSVENAQITVKEKERVCDGGEVTECRYLIFTEQGVYENTDSLVQFKFNSSDIYNEIETGKTYNVEVNWFRVPFFSMYQNILEIYNEVK